MPPQGKSPRRIDFSFLGDASARLSRFLGVSGQLSPSVNPEPEIIPVVLVGDATLPGYGSQSGRRFLACVQSGPSAVGVLVGIKATIDLIVDEVEVEVKAGGDIRLGYGGPNDADLTTLTTQADGVLIDRAASKNEIPPMTGGGTTLAGWGSFPTVQHWYPVAATVGQPLKISTGWYMVAGSKLYVGYITAASQTIAINVRGRLP
jgi:hypothetical protein